jgi:apolipoprotein N-acyltransferase
MDFEQIFSLSSLTVMPLWIAMIVLPGWRFTERVMRSPLSIVLPSALYAALVLPNALAIFQAVSNPSLAGIVQLLGSPQGATIGWVHFLAFDLFVGRWAYLDSRERGIHPLLMAPVLFLILMLGPIGFLLYLALRAVKIADRPIAVSQ